MLILLAIFALLLLAGSLFPWNFELGPALSQAAWNVMTSWRVSLHAASPRDLLLNLVIYLPSGFTGYLWRGWRSSASRWIWPLLAGLCLSFSIETLHTQGAGHRGCDLQRNQHNAGGHPGGGFSIHA